MTTAVMSSVFESSSALFLGIGGFVCVLAVACILYCCYSSRNREKKRKPNYGKRKRRPPNVISQLHGWVGQHDVTLLWSIVQPCGPFTPPAG